MLKNWYNFANPSKKYMAIAYITTIFTSIMYVIEPIFAAKVITSITNQLYTQAYLWLAIGFLQIFLRNSAWHINRKNFGNLNASIYFQINNQIIDKILNAKEINFKQNSKEKMLNILGTDVIKIAHFSDVITKRVAELLRVIITLVIVFTYNIPIGFVLVVIIVIDYIILDKINSNIATHQRNIYEAKDRLSENFTDIIGGRELTRDFDVTSEVKEKYFRSCEGYTTNEKKYQTALSHRDNWLFVFWNFLISLVTCYLIFIVSGGQLELTLYLIIVPYLTSVMDKINTFFTLFSDLKTTNTAALRLNTILNFTTKEFIEFGNNTTNDIDGEISFNDVSYTPTENDEPSYTSLKNVSFHIPKDSITVFYGQKNSGKRMIFYILRRIINPNSGLALISNINIFDYQKSIYKENVSYVTSKPFFFDDSILDNLNMVEKNTEKIINVCKLLNIHDDIMGLPIGYETPLHKYLDKMSPEFQFMLGLARALLTKSEIIMIYELPSTLSSSEKTQIKKVLMNLKETRTFILFTSNKALASFADQAYEIKDGCCTQILNKQNLNNNE